MMMTMLALATLGGAANAAQIADDFTRRPDPAWQLLEGNTNQGKATLQAADDQIIGGGALALPMEIGGQAQWATLDMSVRFRMPDDPTQDWASAAATLYGVEPYDERLYFMVIFGQPGLLPGRALLTLWYRSGPGGEGQLAAREIDIVAGAWHTIRAQCQDGYMSMNAWSDGEAEPQAWMLEAAIPGMAGPIGGVGVRTYGADVPFDDFQAEATPGDGPSTIALGSEHLGWRAGCTVRGIEQMATLRDGEWQEIPFQSGAYGGPSWYLIREGQARSLRLRQPDPERPRFVASLEGLTFSIEYLEAGGRLAIRSSIENGSDARVESIRAGIRLGLDTYMDHYPEWNRKFFPTLMRCEKTHLWGYAMTPKGRVLAIASPDPVASYNLEYIGRGHHIGTAQIEFLNPGPLPDRHPQDLGSLDAGEKRTWTVYLQEVDGLEAVKPAVAELTGAPAIEIDRYTAAAGRKRVITLYGEGDVTWEVVGSDAKAPKATGEVTPDGGRLYTFDPGDKPGICTLKATADGKTSEAMVSVRHPWSWYLRRAREAAVRYPSKANACVEGQYGFFSALLARKHFPDPELDEQLESQFQDVYTLLYDREKLLPLIIPNRIQNTAAWIGLLTDHYEATGDIGSLEDAAGLVEFLISWQGEDGAYRNHGTHYTSVLYCAKLIMEAMEAEKELIHDPVWAERYERHLASVTRAIDDLQRRRDNVQTEGEQTFEDGMIGCTALQLGLYALTLAEPEERQKYVDASLFMWRAHQCLNQTIIPDSRMNGATLRFWEAQYDVMTYPNMMNSPHGWSAWNIYGTYYLYLLTGEEEFLRFTMNALGSCVQVIDGETGDLRWAFISDPYIEASVFYEDPENPGQGLWRPEIIGEEYRPMVSDWWRVPEGQVAGGYVGHLDVPGAACDNDIHEVFKCLEEVALTAAYVLEREDGELLGWNCDVKRKDGKITVTPAEEIVSRVHMNLQDESRVVVRLVNAERVKATVEEMGWVEAR